MGIRYLPVVLCVLGRVWELRLPIEHLWKYLPNGKQNNKDSNRPQDQVSRFLRLKGQGHKI